MRRVQICAVLFTAFASPLAAQNTIIERPQIGALPVQMDAVPIGALVTMLMRDVMRVPYSISPDVLADTRPLSVNLSLSRTDLPVQVVRYLRSLGLRVELVGGTVFVSRPGEQSPGQGGGFAVPYDGTQSSPVAPSAPAPAPTPDVLLVGLAHRSPAELAPIVEAMFPGAVVGSRGKVEAKEGEILPADFEQDTLTVAADRKTLDRIEAFVAAIDKPRPVVNVRGVVLQVASSSSSSSALSVLASVLGGRVQLQGNASTIPGDTSLRIATGGLNAVLSAVKGDGRFKVVAEPALTVASGSVGTLNSGSQVPTLGAVTYTENGAPIRSVVYRDSGVTLTVKPTVRLGEIALDVTQERSSFAKTQTGQDETPTLNRASVSGRFALSPGDTVAFASLEERTESSQRSGLLGGLFSAKSRDKSDAQLIVLLQADVAADRRDGKPTFQRFPARGVGAAPLR